jgi:hypothetical protein
MAEKAFREDRFNWWLPLYAAAGTLLALLILAIASPDWGEILYCVLAVPTVSLVLVILAVRKKGRHRLSALSMLVIYWVVSAALVWNYSAVRDTSRWFLWSKGYKAKVLAQPDPASGSLRHTEWDGWGFVGAGDTVVYLAFDPHDTLVAGAKSHSAGKFSSIPCEVPRIRRLESHWYAVMFYTDADWDHCN